MQRIEVRVKGEIDNSWSDWLDGLTVTATEGYTVVTGPVRDQSAVLGLLNKLSSLGLQVVSMNSEAGDPESKQGGATYVTVQTWGKGSKR
jgi:hypothetical protein